MFKAGRERDSKVMWARRANFKSLSHNFPVGGFQITLPAGFENRTILFQDKFPFRKISSAPITRCKATARETLIMATLANGCSVRARKRVSLLLWHTVKSALADESNNR